MSSEEQKRGKQNRKEGNRIEKRKTEQKRTLNINRVEQSMMRKNE